MVTIRYYYSTGIVIRHFVWFIDSMEPSIFNNKDDILDIYFSGGF